MNDKFEKDEVVMIDYSAYGRLSFRKGKVIEVTQAGNLKVLEEGKTKHEIFTPFGKLRGSDGWNSTYVRKFSQELWDKYIIQNEKMSISNKISQKHFFQYDIEDLRKIKEIIDNYESKNNDQQK